MRNTISQEDKIIAMSLVAAPHTTSSSGDVSHAGLGLCIVSTVGNESQSTTIRYFVVNVSNQTKASMRASTATNLDPRRVVFSADGMALLVASAQSNTLLYRAFFLNDARTTWLEGSDMITPSFAFTTNPVEQLTASVPVSISRGGNGRVSIADGTTGTLQVMESATACGPDKVTFRLVISTNDDPGSVVWRVFEYETYDGYVRPRDVIRECSRCYDNPSLSWTVLVEELCLSKPLPSCLALQVAANFNLDLNGFAGYLMDGDNVVLLGANEGFGVSGENYLHPASTKGACEVDAVPLDCPLPLVFAYDLNSRINFVAWDLVGPGGWDKFGSMEGSNVNVQCLDSPGCYNLSLRDWTTVIGNPNGYFGRYAVFFNKTQILGGAWRFGLEEQVMFGTGC